jgi:glucose/arabinose dehydrogenase
LRRRAAKLGLVTPGTARAHGFFRQLGLALALVTATPVAHGDVLDSNFVDTAFETTAIDAMITGMAWATDGTNRLFVTRKAGQVNVIENGELRDTPFAVVTPLFGQSECGLLAVAFDPDFATNHYVYFFVTVAENEQRIIRYRDDQSIGVEPTVIVSNLPTRGANHDGGALAFGPDGKLYWAVGDLGNQSGVGADLSSPAAKIGRANRDGTLPEGNPFDDGPGPNFDFTWARGFRNPFTMTFQPTTGTLWLNVVGTNYEQVFVVGAGDHGGWADYEALRPAAYLTPVVSYRTNGSDVFSIAANGAARSGGVATFVTTVQHWLRLGERVTIAGVRDGTFDGPAFVTGVPAPNEFTIDQAGSNTLSGDGTATTTALGGCITGGVFLDSTAASPDYANNFFFGDFNSGLILRARVSGSTVTSVETWGDGVPQMIDMDVGPDGDLYYTSHFGWGIIHRVRYRATSQRLVLSRTNLRMLEGGRAAFHVRLAMAPSGDVPVGVARVSGDADVELAEAAALTFGVGDWETPKPVYLRALRDADGVEDTAALEVSASGITERLTVRVTDEFRSAEPPGEGGRGGAAGEQQAGEGGLAGENQGGVAGSGPGGGDAGQAGNGGEPGGEGGDGNQGEAKDHAATRGGCGCAMTRSSARDFAWIPVLAALLLRRRVRR